MSSVRRIFLVAAGFLAACRDSGPTAPLVSPVVAGTWHGTASWGANNCPATVEIEQPGNAAEFTGSIQSSCAIANLYGQLVRSLPTTWGISGRATAYFSYSYNLYQASLGGKVEGSPPTRLSIQTTVFRAGPARKPALQLELTRSTP